jgi:hypothetical protein
MTAITELGINVARRIPAEFWTGLATGKYTAHGGVVRNVAGQIVGHLAMPAASAAMPVVGPALAGLSSASSLVANAQLVSLSRDVQKVMNFAMANTVLSGLGLATSIVGFAYLTKRINGIDKTLGEIDADVKDIKRILQSSLRARLQGAVDTYRLAEVAEDLDTRKQLLMQARSSFGELVHHYKSEFAESVRLEETMVAEGHFVVACMGNAMSTSDLGMCDAAARDLAHHHHEWQSIARKRCESLLELKYATRLLDGRYVDVLPAKTLVRVLDFAHGKKRGIGWIDEIRKPLGKMKIPDFGAIEEPKIEFAKALQARDDILDSYSAHLTFLAPKKVSLTDFARTMSAIVQKENRDNEHAVVNLLEKPAVA